MHSKAGDRVTTVDCATQKQNKERKSRNITRNSGDADKPRDAFRG